MGQASRVYCKWDGRLSKIPPGTNNWHQKSRQTRDLPVQSQYRGDVTRPNTCGGPSKITAHFLLFNRCSSALTSTRGSNLPFLHCNFWRYNEQELGQSHEAISLWKKKIILLSYNHIVCLHGVYVLQLPLIHFLCIMVYF